MSFYRFLQVILFLLILPANSVAEEDVSIRVGVFPFDPINYIDTEGNAQGVYPDLIREIASREGWDVSFVSGSWTECMERLRSGQIDLLTSVAFTPERAEIFSFNKQQVVNIWGEVFIRPGSEINNFNDLHDQKVAVVAGDINSRNYIHISGELGVASRIVEYPTHDDVFRAVANHDAIAGVSAQHYGVRHAGDFGLVGSSLKFSPMSLHFATLKNHFLPVLAQIDTHLATWKADKDSVYYERLAYWIHGTSTERHTAPKWLIVGLLAAVVIVFILIYLNRSLQRKATVLSAESVLEINARKHAEERLAARERTYRLAHFSVEHSQSAMVWLDPDGCFLDCNDRFCFFTGYSREELLKMRVQDIGSTWTQERWDQERWPVSTFGKTPAQIETELLRKDQMKMPVSIEFSRFSFEGDEMLLAVVTDITHRKKAEQVQTQLEIELRQAQKMEAIGTLAGGIAHDFNNILTSMIGCTEMAIRRCADERIGKYLGVVRDGEHRAAELVAQILSFAKQDKGLVKKPLPLVEVVEEVMKLLRASLPATVDIQTTIAEKCRPVMANPSQIHQVIMNLVTNAYQALPATKGRLDIVLEEVDVTTKQAVKYLKIMPGEYVVFSVTDNGCGMTKEQIGRIFDPYFTTRTYGDGTGFGLAIVQRIVQSHDGMIQVESTPGDGSTFRVYLPVLHEEEGRILTDEVVERPSGNEQILLVDDN